MFYLKMYIWLVVCMVIYVGFGWLVVYIIIWFLLIVEIRDHNGFYIQIYINIMPH